MKIKYPKERLEFEKFLKNLGYRNRSPVYKVEKSKGLILEDVISPIKIEIFVYLHKNKKSYLSYCYNEIVKDFRNNMSKEELKKTIKMIAKDIDFNNNIHAKMAEIGWSVKLSNKIKLWEKHDRTKLYVKILRHMKPIIENGIWGIKPQKGDILISRPRGLSFGTLSGVGGIDERQNIKKSRINQKFFNFGPVNSYGDQYCTYDENLNLNAIII